MSLSTPVSRSASNNPSLQPSPVNANTDLPHAPVSPLRESSASPALAPPISSSSIQFKVVQCCNDGSYHPQLLQLDTEASLLTLNAINASPRLPPLEDDDGSSPNTWPVGAIRCLEKCHCDRDRNRAIIVFINEPVIQPIDAIFVDQTTRDIFCELLSSVNRSIVIKYGCGGKNRNDWINDSDVKQCMKCKKEFGLSLRRHHCRRCGGVFCFQCSECNAALPDLGYKTPVRVCGNCFADVRDHRILGLTNNSGSINHTNSLSNGLPTNYTGHHSPAATARQQQQQGGRRNLFVTNDSIEDDDDIEIITAESLHSSTSAITPSPHQSSPRTPISRSGGFREGKRDLYGFIVGQEGTRGQETRPYHLLHLAKQRKRWNQYLVLNPNLEKTPELRRLVRKGIPPELRGQMWQVLSGSINRQQQAPPKYYQSLVDKVQSSPQPCTAEIEKDLRRTFPDNQLYESEEGLAMLRRVLLAYSVHNSRVGYCQSMNFICALCLLFMDEEQAFYLLCYIVEELTCVEVPPPESSMHYYESDLAGAHVDQAVFKDLLAEKLPRIANHFEKLSMPVGPFTVNWFLCLFVNALPLETSLHVWDCMFSEGVKTIFRCALALIKVNEKTILAARDFEQVLMKAKNFHLAAAESSEFARVMFDSMWMGAFPMSRINQLRKLHRGRITRELKERQRQLELNHAALLARPPPSQFKRPATNTADSNNGNKTINNVSVSVSDANDDGDDEQKSDISAAASKLTINSDTLRMQLHLPESVDPYLAISPSPTSAKTNGSESSTADTDTSININVSNLSDSLAELDSKYVDRYRSFGNGIGPEHAKPVIVDNYYNLDRSQPQSQPLVDSDPHPRKNSNSSASEDSVEESYVNVGKPHINTSTDPSTVDQQHRSSSFGSPSSARGKSSSLNGLPPPRPAQQSSVSSSIFDGILKRFGPSSSAQPQSTTPTNRSAQSDSTEDEDEEADQVDEQAPILLDSPSVTLPDRRALLDRLQREVQASEQKKWTQVSNKLLDEHPTTVLSQSTPSLMDEKPRVHRSSSLVVVASHPPVTPRTVGASPTRRGSGTQPIFSRASLNNH